MAEFPRVWLAGDKTWAENGFTPEQVLTHRGYVLVDDAAQADVIVTGSASLRDAAAEHRRPPGPAGPR
jgi:hypothetical protein